MCLGISGSEGLPTFRAGILPRAGNFFPTRRGQVLSLKDAVLRGRIRGGTRAKNSEPPQWQRMGGCERPSSPHESMRAHPLQPRRSEAAMNVRPSILCPIDFSEGSAGALRYAAAIASHFATRLIVLSVEDPLLTEAADLRTGIVWDPEECKREMARFAGKVFGPESLVAGDARVRRRGRQTGAGDPARGPRALLRSDRRSARTA